MAELAEKRDSKAFAIKDAAFKWDDPLDLGRLTEDERMVRDAARAYAQEKLLPRVLDAFRHESYDPRDLARDGRARLPRPDHAGGIRRRRGQLCRLRPDRARDRARRFRLPLGDERAVVAGDVSDLRLRLRGAAAEISAEARQRRMGRLLRPDRARPRLRSRPHGDPRREGRRRLSAHRRQDVDHQFADRRRRRGLGQARRRDPRLHRRARREGFVDAEDRGQVLACAPRSPARSCSTTCSCRKTTCCRTSHGLAGPFGCLNRRALRHRLGRDGRGGILLARARANTRSTASSSAGRSPPTS